jgi:HEPN domain-containing protein
MKRLTGEWVAKAEGDFRSMEREMRARRDPNYDDACFHAQQCAEKHLKGRLYEAGIRFTKTHDLKALLGQALAVQPLWEAHRADLLFLNEFSVELRYPGTFANREKAAEARACCRAFRKSARVALGLKP